MDQPTHELIKAAISEVKKEIQDLEAKEAAQIDSNYKDNKSAIAALTRSETRSIRRSQVIDSFSSLVDGLREGFLENV